MTKNQNINLKKLKTSKTQYILLSITFNVNALLTTFKTKICHCYPFNINDSLQKFQNVILYSYNNISIQNFHSYISNTTSLS